ncbi:hypothetical protein BD777DRAFT_44215 [Yarrowia lipolytica]|nr:hypothetical protein BD777DRAFT_44215 [Yarrowia lipolytica]
MAVLKSRSLMTNTSNISPTVAMDMFSGVMLSVFSHTSTNTDCTVPITHQVSSLTCLITHMSHHSPCLITHHVSPRTPSQPPPPSSRCLFHLKQTRAHGSDKTGM